MQKTKSSPSNKILSKRWRNKYKENPNNTTAIWRPEGYCTWSSVGGRKVVLQPTNILNFSKTSEQTALQQVALSKVQERLQGCSVVIPKACTDVKRHKKTMMKKRSQSVNLGGLLEHLTQKDRDKADKDEPQPMGLVFGIPLTRCIANDNELRKRRQQNSAENVDQHKHRNQSSSSHGSTENLPRQNGNPSHSGNTANNRSFHAGSSDSLSESDASSRHTGGSTNLIDALSLSMTGRDSLHNDNLEHLNSEGPMVPQIVTACFKHIETYGLHVLGIFRVGCSKKRVKQLRDEFDSGKDVVLDETQNPHEVGALLKEYFRDLPEPLLTRDLYSPFVATRKIHCPEQQILAVKLLVALLPVPIRDTLWALMKFLKKVAEHSTDSIGENGEQLPGNKMGSSNLATLFGPNILHKAKSSGEREYLVESTARAEERKEVIEVVKDMIDSNTSMFEISAEMYDEVLRQMMKDDPGACDNHLKHLASDLGIETDLDTSYGSVFDDSNYRQSPHHYASASDILQSSHVSVGSNRPILRQTASTSSPTHYPTSDSDRDDTDPRQGLSDYHDRQAGRILRQRGKQSSAQMTTTSSPTTGGLRVPCVRLPQRSLSSDKDNRTMQTTTLTIPQQSHYLRQNSCPGLSSSPPSSPPVSPVVPFSRPLGSTCSRQNTPVDKGSRSERELSQTGRTRQLTRSRETSPVDRLKVSPSSSSTTLAVSGTPSGATPLQHGQPQRRTATDSHLIRSAVWQRERWRQWEMLTTESSDDKHEQETLV